MRRLADTIFMFGVTVLTVGALFYFNVPDRIRQRFWPEQDRPAASQPRAPRLPSFTRVIPQVVEPQPEYEGWAADPTARADVSAYRNQRVAPRASRVRLRGGQPDAVLQQLIDELVVGIDDPFQRVKVLHDWIALNIEYDMPAVIADDLPRPDWEVTLRRRKAVCGGFSRLLQEMCERINIPCAEVAGWERGFSVDELRTMVEADHAWNAVQIDGQWYLIDATWDTGYSDGDRFVAHYTTDYLFAPPEQFIYTHFPEDESWQLLDPPLTKQAFQNQPLLKGRFFGYGMSVKTALTRVNRAASSSAVLDINVPSDVDLAAYLETVGGRRFDDNVLLQRHDGEARINVLFPRAGRWQVRLFAKPSVQEGALYEVARFGIDSQDGSNQRFPKVFGDYVRYQANMESLVLAPLRPNRSYTFQLRVPGVAAVRLIIERNGDKKSLDFTRLRSDPSMWVLQTVIPPHQRVRVAVKKQPGDRQMPVLLEY